VYPPCRGGRSGRSSNRSGKASANGAGHLTSQEGSSRSLGSFPASPFNGTRVFYPVTRTGQTSTSSLSRVGHPVCLTFFFLSDTPTSHFFSELSHLTCVVPRFACSSYLYFVFSRCSAFSPHVTEPYFLRARHTSPTQWQGVMRSPRGFP
jgi:hypothetical protein